jgi:hypothetical protein
VSVSTNLLCPKVCSLNKANNRVTLRLGESDLSTVMAKNYFTLMLKEPGVGVSVVFANVLYGFGFLDRKCPPANNPNTEVIGLRQNAVDVSFELNLSHLHAPLKDIAGTFAE